MIDNIRQTLTAVKDSASEVGSNVSEVESIADRSREAVTVQLAQTNEVSTTIEEVAESAADVSRLAEEAFSSQSRLAEKASSGASVVLIESCFRLEKREKTIQNVNSELCTQQ